jgi:hypothetical protein
VQNSAACTSPSPPDGAVAGYSQAGFDNGTNNAAQSTAGTATAIVELQLDNTGRTPVELQDGVLDVPGWAVQAEGLLTTGQSADLHLVRHVVCAQELRSPAPDPTAMLLDVRLPSGRSLRTRVPLPRLGAAGAQSAVGLAATLHEVPRRACGLLPPGQALEVTGQGRPLRAPGPSRSGCSCATAGPCRCACPACAPYRAWPSGPSHRSRSSSRRMRRSSRH